MKIHRFDPTAGRYHFELEGIETTVHAHPAAELILARAGTFALRANAEVHTGLTYALLPPGNAHQVTASGGGSFKLFLLEIFPAQATRFSLVFGNDSSKIPHLQKQFHATTAIALPDARLNDLLEFLKSADYETPPDLNQLAARVHLSPSRLSHLFRAQTDIPLQHYLLWCRLRATVAHYLADPTSLRDAAHRNGFHDSAHLNRTFRKFFGVAPSFAYNSRNVQLG